MDDWAAFSYMGFWDVPRIFLVRHRGETLLFDSPFDEELDDYPDVYRVFLMPSFREDELPKDWTTLKLRAKRFLGEVSLAQVRFDPTLRESIHVGILDELLACKAAG